MFIGDDHKDIKQENIIRYIHVVNMSMSGVMVFRNLA